MLVDTPDSDEVTQRARSAIGQVVGRIGHVRLTGDELQRLPELLGQMPGAFFVALRDLRSVDRKGNRWVLRRMSGTALTLAPLAGDAFGQRMRDLLASDAWCVVAGWA